MARGKEAIATAQRRAADAEAAAASLRSQLAEAKEAYDRDAKAFRSELARVKANLMADAARLAAEEVRRRLEEVAEARRRRGMSDDIAVNLLYQKDQFTMNACRYVSMTTGKGPFEALELVLTWITEEDFWGIPDRVEFLIKYGLPHDGWVARTLRLLPKHWDKVTRRAARGEGRPITYSLDRAEDERFSSIHANYKPSWYPRIKYRGIELIEDEDAKGAAERVA